MTPDLAAWNAARLDAMRAIWETAADHMTRWDEGAEQRMSQVAESWDDETHTYRRLSPRKDHR